MDLELPRAERCRDFESYEACADDDGALRRLRLPDYGAAVGERAQGADVRQIASGQVEAHWLGAGRAAQSLVGMAAAVLRPDTAQRPVDQHETAGQGNTVAK